MRVAVLNDIHGNLPAVEAVLENLRHESVDRIVVGGDVFPGPMAHSVLRRLLAFGPPVDFIYGNGDIAVRELLAGELPSRLPESYRPMISWNADQLTGAERAMLASWLMTLVIDVEPLGAVLFCHATPRNEHEIFTELTPEERLIPIFEAANTTVVVCGHTHMQFDRRVGRTRVVNAGSVGMPFGEPGAHWLLLGPDIELRRTTYDLNLAVIRIRQSGYPGAEEFVAKYLLHPPGAAEMLDVFSQVELKN